MCLQVYFNIFVSEFPRGKTIGNGQNPRKNFGIMLVNLIKLKKKRKLNFGFFRWII